MVAQCGGGGPRAAIPGSLRGTGGGEGVGVGAVHVGRGGTRVLGERERVFVRERKGGGEMSGSLRGTGGKW